MERSDADLTPAECWALLAVASVGRLALSVRALPRILPVRYTVDDESSVAIHLGTSGMSAADVHDSVVAFAVDRIDEGDDAGWIVHMQGLARRAEPRPGARGSSATDQVVRLVPGVVTGHRFTLQPVAPAS